MFSHDGWAEKYDRAAQDFLGGERVLAAVQVSRANGWSTMAIGAVSGLGGMLSSALNKKRAGGLPQLFLLAVTEERVYALALPKMSSGTKPRAVEELARWERAGLAVETGPATMGVKLTISSPSEQERIVVQGPPGELTGRVVRAIAAQPAVAR